MEKENKISLDGYVVSDQYYIKEFTNPKGNEAKLLKFKIHNINNKKHNYFDIITWNNTAEWVANDIKKGDYITVNGYLESNAYLKNNEKVYTINIIADEIYLIQSAEKVKENQILEKEEVTKKTVSELEKILAEDDVEDGLNWKWDL
ncbi:Single-strand binding family protein [Metamycoplasma auris 15026]|uniref:Single-stranded DNA-binding protein n=1 Tax=Metamycoplasma auris 15026 TaxID=1188233 RepID=N9TRL0_9BACT|nr:single-stranded DNA-binding protein [Metamycoplasma auris]ENY68804.1 Single-strand binding family protein [Metamycoplasma auris 15026]